MSNNTSVCDMFRYCKNLKTIILMNLDSTKLNSYERCFNGAATGANAEIIVNYTSSIEDKIDDIIATGRGNIVKGEKISENE